jgi:ribose transport system permease protein
MAEWLRRPVAKALGALLLVLLLGCLFHADGTFFRWQTHQGMLRFISIHGILACGMTLVIITAGIDLAVGSVLGFSAVLFSMSALHWGWSWPAAIGMTLVCGVLLGLVSGSLITWGRIQPFIATLAMMVFARGLAKALSGGQKISNYQLQDDGTFQTVELPGVFEALDARLAGGSVAVVTLVFVLCAAAAWLLLARSRMGRWFYAVGGGEEAARLSGVPVLRVKLTAYALCGFFSAVAGVCQAAQEQQGDPEAGATYELMAIAIVVIGGTSLMGGVGGMGLTLIGALTIGTMQKILSINGIDEATRLMLTGAIIVAAVLLQRNNRTT